MEASKPSPKDKKNRKAYCAIQNCSSKSSRDTHLSYHKFPKAKSHSVPAKNFFGNIEKVDVVDGLDKSNEDKERWNIYESVFSPFYRKRFLQIR